MLQLRLDLSAIAICLQKKLSSLGYRDFLILCITEYRTGSPPSSDSTVQLAEFAGLYGILSLARL